MRNQIANKPNKIIKNETNQLDNYPLAVKSELTFKLLKSTIEHKN